jgi:hypothetical protein
MSDTKKPAQVELEKPKPSNADAVQRPTERPRPAKPAAPVTVDDATGEVDLRTRCR